MGGVYWLILFRARSSGLGLWPRKQNNTENPVKTVLIAETDLSLREKVCGACYLAKPTLPKGNWHYPKVGLPMDASCRSRSELPARTRCVLGQSSDRDLDPSRLQTGPKCNSRHPGGEFRRNRRDRPKRSCNARPPPSRLAPYRSIRY